MSASLMKRAALQEKLAENFEKEAERLAEDLSDLLADATQTPEHNVSSLQQLAMMESPQKVRERLKERYNVTDAMTSQIVEGIERLNEAEFESAHARFGLQKTNQRRRLRRRQKS